MRPMSHLSFAVIAGLLVSACSPPDKKLVGNWTTHKGECKTEGEIVIEVYDKKVEVDFMCFAKTCARFGGKVDQAGYFHFKLSKNQTFEGRITGDFSRGNWGVIMEEGFCEGSFRASPPGT